MKTLGNSLSWIGVGFLALLGLGAFGSGDILAGIFLVVIAVALLPISPIKDLWAKLPKKFKWVKVVSLVVLFFIGIAFSSPVEETKVSQPETSDEAIVTQEKKDDKKPADKDDAKEDANQEQKKTTEEQERDGEKEEIPTETTSKTPEVTSETTEVPTTTTKPSVSTTTKAPVTTTSKAPVTTTTKAPTTTTQTPTTTTTPPTTTTKAPVGGNGDADNDDTNGQTVYRTPKGSRWHIDPQCGGANSYPVQRSQAEAAGLTPCRTCVH